MHNKEAKICVSLLFLRADGNDTLAKELDARRFPSDLGSSERSSGQSLDYKRLSKISAPFEGHDITYFKMRHFRLYG